MSAKTKVCSDCERRLPLDRFERHPRCKLGVRPQCKQCSRARRERTGATSASYASALRRLRDAHPRDFAAFLAEERGHTWEASPDPESSAYWRDRWLDTATRMVDVLDALDEAASVLEAEGLTRCAERARQAIPAGPSPSLEGEK